MAVVGAGILVRRLTGDADEQKPEIVEVSSTHGHPDDAADAETTATREPAASLHVPRVVGRKVLVMDGRWVPRVLSEETGEGGVFVCERLLLTKRETVRDHDNLVT